MSDWETTKARITAEREAWLAELEEHRGALADLSREDLIRLAVRRGITSITMSGHTVEGAEFFQKTPTVDLRSLLEDMQVMGPWESLSDEQTEAQFAALGDTSYKGKVRCKCRCGYSCGRRCDLPLEQCLREHYGRDCEHVWDGPWEEYSMGGSKTCSKCGDSAMGHDMAVGP